MTESKITIKEVRNCENKAPHSAAHEGTRASHMHHPEFVPVIILRVFLVIRLAGTLLLMTGDPRPFSKAN